MLIALSLLLLTLIRSSFRSLDSTIPTPFLPCLFAPLRPTCILLPTLSPCLPSISSPAHTTIPPFSSPSDPPTPFLSFFNWAGPCPSSPCPLITGFRRITCASPTGNALAAFEARCLISLIIGVWLGFYDRMPFLTSTTVVSGGPNHWYRCTLNPCGNRWV